MINDFFHLIEGKFCNKIQAMSYPSRYAMINITHVNIGNGFIYGEQAYNYDPKHPYRQFILSPVVEDGKIRIKNYELKDPSTFVNFNNLHTISINDISLRDGCDVILEQQEDGSFKGGLHGCDCKVDWMGRDTYLQNEIELTKDFYYVMDRGYCSKHNHQIWGSKYGRFEFARLPN